MLIRIVKIQQKVVIRRSSNQQSLENWPHRTTNLRFTEEVRRRSSQFAKNEQVLVWCLNSTAQLLALKTSSTVGTFTWVDLAQTKKRCLTSTVTNQLTHVLTEHSVRTLWELYQAPSQHWCWLSILSNWAGTCETWPVWLEVKIEFFTILHLMKHLINRLRKDNNIIIATAKLC